MAERGQEGTIADRVLVVSDPQGSRHIARLAGGVMLDAARRGYPLPACVAVDARPFVRRGRALRGVPALADYRSNEIYVNPASYQFRDDRSIRKYARRLHARGRASTPHPGHVLRHELAHLLHAREAGVPYVEAFNGGSLDRECRRLAERVSLRAQDSPTEFVAEVFAGVWDGREYDGDVMALYRSYRGPMFAPPPVST